MAAARTTAASENPGPCAFASALICGTVVALACLSPALAQTPDAPPVFPIDQRWRIALADHPSAPPLVDAGRVFVAVAGQWVDALALDDGSTLWSVTIDVSTGLAAGDGLVIVASQAGLAALDAATGDERWRAPVGAQAAAPSSRAGWVVAPTADGEVVALRAADGRIIWRETLGAPAAAAAAIDGDRVYLALRDGRIVARRIDTGDPVWEAQLTGPGRGVLVRGDRVYVGSLDNRFYCLAARDGRQLWSWRTGADLIGGAAVDDERVYFASLDNTLYALDRRTGVRRWRSTLPTRPVGSPSLAGAAVFTPVATRALLFAPRRDGRRVARVPLTADLFVASAFDAAGDVMLVVGTVDATGQAELGAFGRAAFPPAPSALTWTPGLGVGVPFPLVRTALPLRFVALPALPRRGG